MSLYRKHFSQNINRTRVYIAADFDHDRDAVEQLKKWNDGHYWSLHFSNAHDLQSSRDTSLPCSIKSSLHYRMSGSKLFVLIVGEHTANLTKGSCQGCHSYNSWNKYCVRGNTVDFRSYVKYECDQALKANIPIIALYKNTEKDLSKCPESNLERAVHVPLLYWKQGVLCWDYQAVKNVFEKILK